MCMPATKSCIFFEQSFLNVKAVLMGLIVKLTRFCNRKTVNLPVAKQHIVECFSGVFGHGGQQLIGPHFFHFKAFGKFHQLPEI